MKIQDKTILIFGSGLTGISSIKALSSLGGKVYLYDENIEAIAQDTMADLNQFKYELIEQDSKIDWSSIDILLKSPGIRLDHPLISRAKSYDIPVVSDVELAYQIWPNLKFIGISGTNGKTTTAFMVKTLLDHAGIKNQLVGNIGIGLLWTIYTHGLDTQYILELSSFQLASTESFKPQIYAITNLGEDHLDWHGNLDAYLTAKTKVATRLESSDLLILDYNDPITNDRLSSFAGNVRYISTKEVLTNGSSFLDGHLYYNANKTNIKRQDLSLVGEHNAKNLLFALEIVRTFGIAEKVLEEGVKKIKAIEHRIEFVREVDGAKYYNDSKATNVDSTVKALEGFTEQLILIAGGYDKKANYHPIFEDRENIKTLILIGETKDKIQAVAREYDIHTILADTMEQAVNVADLIADSGDVVLLSPACASWGMYKNFEERGADFKYRVKQLL